LSVQARLALEVTQVHLLKGQKKQHCRYSVLYLIRKQPGTDVVSAPYIKLWQAFAASL